MELTIVPISNKPVANTDTLTRSEYQVQDPTGDAVMLVARDNSSDPLDVHVTYVDDTMEVQTIPATITDPVQGKFSISHLSGGAELVVQWTKDTRGVYPFEAKVIELAIPVDDNLYYWVG